MKFLERLIQIAECTRIQSQKTTEKNCYIIITIGTKSVNTNL